MKLFSFLANYPLHTKLSIAFLALTFVAIPITVLSVNQFRDARLKAATNLGDPYYPDPAVSWTKEPYYQIEICLNTRTRGGAYCQKFYQTGGTSFTHAIASGFPSYYWVETLVYSTYPNVQWTAVANGQKSCSSSSATCGTTISWPAPVQRIQATKAGDPNTNVCIAGTPASCVSAVNVTYPGKTAQFVDFQPNYIFDVYIFINGKLFDSKAGLNSGPAAAFGKPTLTAPSYGASGVSTDPSFQWQKVDGASRYGLWVSESSDFVTKPFWSVDVAQSSCSTSCTRTWSAGGWTAQHGATAAPAKLASGKLYYWLVWACLSTTCPVNSMSQAYNFTTASLSLPAPFLQGPSGVNIDNNPTFKWSTVSGATYYTLGVSDRADILSFSGLYISRLLSTQCAALQCQISWNNGLKFTSFRSIDPKPYVFPPGKTYYWFVWACSSECPLSSISKVANFTVIGGSTQVAPVLISPIKGAINDSGKPLFSWYPSANAPIDRYKILIKRNNTNFASGDFWSKDVSPLVCWNKPNCSTELAGSWSWTKGTLDNPATPPNPLTDGYWYWMIITCKTQSCGLVDMLASTVGYFKVAAVAAKDLNVTFLPVVPTTSACKPNLKVDVNFKWTPANTNATTQLIYLSTQNNNFAPGTYLTVSLPFGLTANYVWPDLLSGTTHYWKVVTIANGGYYYESQTVSFVTPTCSQAGGKDFDRPGTKGDIISYIYQITAADPPDLSGYSLGNALVYTMAGNGGLTPIQGPSPNGESGGGDCAYNPAYQTIGIFQYMAGTWKSSGGVESRDAVDSGRLAYSNCWKNPGSDAPNWSSSFGGNNDNNAWDPYAQARATRLIFLNAGQCSQWQVYSERFCS